MWTKLQKKYDVSKIIEDNYIPFTSGHAKFSSLHQRVAIHKVRIVCGDENCNVYGELDFDDALSLSYCNGLSLDFNTSSTIDVLHACVDSPCIYILLKFFLSKFHTFWKKKVITSHHFI
jgi:hypothetical protein